MVGNRLADYRKANNFSKEEMARKLLVTIERYSDLESNKYIPNSIETAQMASLLGVTKEYLEAGEYDLWKARQNTVKIMKTPSGKWICTEEYCEWRKYCGGGKYYCPGSGCMKCKSNEMKRNENDG